MHPMNQRFKVVYIIILLVGFSARAETNQSLFQQGNQLYNQSEFLRALEAYQKIEATDYENGPLYFNMGNCYYKLGQISKAILYYERARRFIPRDEDLKTNLAIAQLSVVDKIVPDTDFILVQAYHTFLTFLPKNIQLIAVITFYLILMLGWIIVILSQRSMARFIGNRMVWIFGILFTIISTAYLLRILDEKNRVEAIIMADKVEVMSAPSESSGVELFGLHAGTKVRLDQSSGDWVEIILSDRKTGWVKQNVLETI